MKFSAATFAVLCCYIVMVDANCRIFALHNLPQTTHNVEQQDNFRFAASRTSSAHHKRLSAVNPSAKENSVHNLVFHDDGLHCVVVPLHDALCPLDTTVPVVNRSNLQNTAASARLSLSSAADWILNKAHSTLNDIQHLPLRAVSNLVRRVYGVPVDPQPKCPRRRPSAPVPNTRLAEYVVSFWGNRETEVPKQINPIPRHTVLLDDIDAEPLHTQTFDGPSGGINLTLLLWANFLGSLITAGVNLLWSAVVIEVSAWFTHPNSEASSVAKARRRRKHRRTIAIGRPQVHVEHTVNGRLAVNVLAPVAVSVAGVVHTIEFGLLRQYSVHFDVLFKVYTRPIRIIRVYLPLPLVNIPNHHTIHNKPFDIIDLPDNSDRVSAAAKHHRGRQTIVIRPIRVHARLTVDGWMAISFRAQAEVSTGRVYYINGTGLLRQSSSFFDVLGNVCAGCIPIISIHHLLPSPAVVIPSRHVIHDKPIRLIGHRIESHAVTAITKHHRSRQHHPTIATRLPRVPVHLTVDERLSDVNVNVCTRCSHVAHNLSLPWAFAVIPSRHSIQAIHPRVNSNEFTTVARHYRGRRHHPTIVIRLLRVHVHVTADGWIVIGFLVRVEVSTGGVFYIIGIRLLHQSSLSFDVLVEIHRRRIPSVPVHASLSWPVIPNHPAIYERVNHPSKFDAFPAFTNLLRGQPRHRAVFINHPQSDVAAAVNGRLAIRAGPVEVSRAGVVHTTGVGLFRKSSFPFGILSKAHARHIHVVPVQLSLPRSVVLIQSPPRPSVMLVVGSKPATLEEPSGTVDKGKAHEDPTLGDIQRAWAANETVPSPSAIAHIVWEDWTKMVGFYTQPSTPEVTTTDDVSSTPVTVEAKEAADVRAATANSRLTYAKEMKEKEDPLADPANTSDDTRYTVFVVDRAVLWDAELFTYLCHAPTSTVKELVHKHRQCVATDAGAVLKPIVQDCNDSLFLIPGCSTPDADHLRVETHASTVVNPQDNGDDSELPSKCSPKPLRTRTIAALPVRNRMFTSAIGSLVVQPKIKAPFVPTEVTPPVVETLPRAELRIKGAAARATDTSDICSFSASRQFTQELRLAQANSSSKASFSFSTTGPIRMAPQPETSRPLAQLPRRPPPQSQPSNQPRNSSPLSDTRIDTTFTRSSRSTPKTKHSTQVREGSVQTGTGDWPPPVSTSADPAPDGARKIKAVRKRRGIISSTKDQAASDGPKEKRA